MIRSAPTFNKDNTNKMIRNDVQGNDHKVAGTQIAINGQNAKVKVIAKSPLGRNHNFTYYYLTMEDAKIGVEDREKMYIGTSGYKYEYYERQGRKWSLIEQ